jgi:hypothetical protein
MQRKNLKDEEYFDREIWRTKIMSLSWGKLCIHGKIPKINKFQIWGSQGGEIIVFGNVTPVVWYMVPTYRRNLLPLSSG